MKDPRLVMFLVVVLLLVVAIFLWRTAAERADQAQLKYDQEQIQTALYRDSLHRADAHLQLLRDSLIRLNPDSLFAVGVRQGQSIKDVYEKYLQARLSARVLPDSDALRLFTRLNTDTSFTGLDPGQ